jgi:hypothetical protein
VEKDKNPKDLRHSAAYGKGKKDAVHTNPAEHFLDGMASLVLPDSLGTTEYQSRRAGYGDYFEKEHPKATPPPQKETPIDPSEKAWFALCEASKFIPDAIVSQYQRVLLAQGNQGSFHVGLSKFTAHTCPRCGAVGQFRVHFLGRLQHPDCGWEGYMGTGSYIGFQFLQTLHTGYRAGGGIKAQGDKKGEQHTWVSALFGFVIVAIFRAAAAVVLIPIHIIVSLCQPAQPREERLQRLAWLAAFLVLVGFSYYEVKDQAARLSGIESASRSSFPAAVQNSSTSSPRVSGTNYALLDKNPMSANNWVKIADSGGASLRFLSPQPLEIIAPPVNPSGITLYTQQVLNGDLDASFVFNHQGFGRTSVGLWSTATNDWAAVAILDTNDTNYLAFSAGGPSTEGRYSGSPYMNRWIVMRFLVHGSRVDFFANGTQLESMNFVPGAFRLAVSVGCASWKSGANDTAFRLVSATGRSN